ncbi:MAG TPA: ABC transporter substrate-binding protein [Gemmatimonadaceae bacterium]|jgi:ABC-type Fe3+-hydroxamate transport system, periplasmic component
MPRIVSFLPAATEIVCALGAGDELVGRSHECDYPASVHALPVVSRPALSLDGLSQAEIDAAVAGRLASGESLYVVDECLLDSLAPDVILTQDLCQVCAPSGNELTRALASIPSRPEVLYLTPRTLAEIDANIVEVGRAIGREAEARALVARNHERISRLQRSERRRRVMFLEWTDPPYCAGHWVPEMIELAGGEDPLGRPGADSVRVSWDDVRAAEPEIVIVAPCGYGLAEAEQLVSTLPEIPGARVVPVDANAYFARPGPRYAEGIELLTGIFSSEELGSQHTA